MKSNSLDIKLKKTEEELKQHEQEIADQHELHKLTVKELELSKESHKIAQDQIQQQKQKVSIINIISLEISSNSVVHGVFLSLMNSLRPI